MPKRRFLKLDDTFWVWLERAESSMHVGGLAIFQPDAPASEAAGDVVRGFRGHADVTGRFNQVVTPRSFPFRSTKHEAADVDIDYHLRHLALPRPGGERELGTMVSRSTPRPTTRW